MRKLVYISESGKETGSMNTAKSWKENFTIKLEELPRYSDYTKEDKKWLEEREKTRKFKNSGTH